MLIITELGIFGSYHIGGLNIKVSVAWNRFHTDTEPTMYIYFCMCYTETIVKLSHLIET